MAEVSIFSFFAGCGILDLAFETSNFNIVFVNEFSPVFMEGYQFARGRLELPAPEYGFHNDSAERYSKRKDLQRWKSCRRCCTSAARRYDVTLRFSKKRAG